MTCQVVDGFILIGPKTVKDYLLLILGIFSDVGAMQIERILRCVDFVLILVENIQEQNQRNFVGQSCQT